MTGFKIFFWFVLTAVLYAAWFAALWPLRKKNKIWLGVALAAAEFLLAAVAAYVDIASAYLLPRGWQCLLAMFYTVWLADAATGAILLLARCLKKDGFKGALRFAAGFCVTLLYLCYMVVNAQVVTADRHTYTSEKLTREHTFVFLSDLHYGHTQSRGVVEKTLEKIKAEDPEFILLGGDITDEFTSKEDMQYLYGRIGALGVPVYFVYGNHDRQDHAADVGGRTYSDEDLTAALTAAGIRVLCDDCAELDDLVLLGRENENAAGRKAVGELPARPAGKYVVTVDHSPYQYDDIAKTGADLQVSGHVHAGQLFPLRLIYPLFVHNICGEYRDGDTVVYVSSGASGWCFPLRSQAHCRYEVFHLTTP